MHLLKVTIKFRVKRTGVKLIKVKRKLISLQVVTHEIAFKTQYLNTHLKVNKQVKVVKIKNRFLITCVNY